MTTDEMILQLDIWADKDPENRSWSIARETTDEDTGNIYYVGEIFDNTKDEIFEEFVDQSMGFVLQSMVTFVKEELA
jgi:hypothetical protein